MMATVPEADAVLKCEPDKSTDRTVTGKVTGKGVDSPARTKRELAEAHHVPLAETLPLARALHAGVGLDQGIPPEPYKAAAEFTGYVWRLKGRMLYGSGRIQAWHSRPADDTGESGMQRQPRT